MRAVGLAMCFALAGCGTSQIADAARQDRLAIEAKTIGKRKVSTGFAYICPIPNDTRPCPYIKGSPGLVGVEVAGSSPFGQTSYQVLVRTDDGQTGYVSLHQFESMDDEAAYKAEQAKKAAAKADCDRRGGVRIGMTKAEALASCWGKPSKINTTTTATRTHEQWVYGSRSYLYFDNGILSTIQN